MHDPMTKRHFERTIRSCGAITMATGMTALAGWISGIQLLTRISPRYIPMAPDTALTFAILGAVLLMHGRSLVLRMSRVPLAGLAGIVGGYGLLKALEFPLGADLTFANVLFPPKELLGPYVVGRMSPVTGALFFLSGTAVVALLSRRYRHRLRMLIGGIGVVVACAGFLTTYAYVLNFPFFYQGHIIPLAAPTAFAFCVLGIGLVAAAGPDSVLKPFVGPSTKSRALRLFVPLAVLICFAQEILHNALLSAELHRALIVLLVPLAAALVAVAGGERLAQYLASRLQKAEHFLEESEEKYRSMVEHSHDLIWALDRQGNFTYFNRRCEEVSGYRLLDWVGRSFASVLNPDDVSRFQDIFNAALRGKPQEYDVTVYRADGSAFILEVASAPEYRSGEVVGVVSFGKDITERKQAEEALWENMREIEHSNNVLEQILESIPFRVFWKDRDSKYMGCNTRFAQDSGLNQVAELLERTDFEMGWKDQAELYRVDDQEVMRSDRPKLNIVEPRTTPDGKTIWLSTSKVPLRSSTGDVWGILGLYEEITERKRSEEALRRLQQAVDTSGEVIFMTDANGTFTYVNPAFTALYGYAAADVVGKTSPRILKSGLTDAQTYSQFWKTLQRKDIFRAELINRTKDGRNVTVEVSVNPIVSERGEVEGFLAVQRDMSERTRAEEERHNLESQLRQAQKMETIGTLAGGVAHDFNNILTPILVYSEMAAKHLGHDHPTRSDLDHVIAGATRAKDLVKQILTFSRQTEHERIPIELSPIVKEALKLLQASLPSTIAIDASIQTGCGDVLADPSQIHQVLMNLCTNAYHAMRDDGGELTVKLEAITLTEPAARALPALLPGEFIRLTVADTGCGMDDQTQERIFEPFFTTKKVGEGTGLGLSVVHGIVASHGGAISVQSVVGKGSVFDVYLPRIGVTHKTQILDETAVVGGDERILVIDDEPEVADVLKDALEEIFGYEVTVRTSSVDALELLRAQPDRFDLVITDLTMPYLTGDHLAREIRAIRKDLPVILMTGFSETFNEERCRQLGIAGFLLKPPLSADLARLVRKVLDGVSQGTSSA